MTYVSPKKVQVQLISLPGFLQGRREAAPPGDSLQTQNPTLHERPGAVPATPGLHRRLERAERIGARTSSAITTQKRKANVVVTHLKKTTSSISGLLSEQLKKKKLTLKETNKRDVNTNTSELLLHGRPQHVPPELPPQRYLNPAAKTRNQRSS